MNSSKNNRNSTVQRNNRSFGKPNASKSSPTLNLPSKRNTKSQGNNHTIVNIDVNIIVA